MRYFFLLILSLFSAAVFAEFKVLPLTERVTVLMKEQQPQQTFAVVRTENGVVLINSGASEDEAKTLAQAIKALSPYPVQVVINLGAADAHWQGNGFFREQGALIVAERGLIAAQQQVASEQQVASSGFEDFLSVDLGGTLVEIFHPSALGKPGSSYVWLPQQKVLLVGGLMDQDAEIPDSVLEHMASLGAEYMVWDNGQPQALRGKK